MSGFLEVERDSKTFGGVRAVDAVIFPSTRASSMA